MTFPHGFTIQGRLAAVTFARVGCFTKAYAKTTWSFPDEGDDGKKQEYLYWDDAAYGLLYDSPAYKNALATKETEGPKTDDVDVEAFLNSLAGEGATSKSESDVVVAPPAINLSLAGVLYARLENMSADCSVNKYLTLLYPVDQQAMARKVSWHGAFFRLLIIPKLMSVTVSQRKERLPN